MKKLLLLLFVVVSFTACKKDPEVGPKALADRFTGTYQLSSFRYTDEDGDTEFPKLPYTNNGKTISGTLTMTKKSDTVVDMTLTLKATGIADDSVTFEDLEVREVGSEYGLFAEGERIADVDGSTVIFNYSDSEQELAFIAKK